MGLVCFLFCLVLFRRQLGYIADGSQDRCLTILRAATHETEWIDHEFCLSRSPTQPVGTRRPHRESNIGPPHQESGALPTELPRALGLLYYRCYEPGVALKDQSIGEEGAGSIQKKMHDQN